MGDESLTYQINAAVDLVGGPDESSRAAVAGSRRWAASDEDDGIPERELPAWQDPQLADSVRSGAREAQAGTTVDLGDFTRYLDGDDA